MGKPRVTYNVIAAWGRGPLGEPWGTSGNLRGTCNIIAAGGVHHTTGFPHTPSLSLVNTPLGKA
eukprot:3773807-Karenia_brevis.AAC.1